MKYSSKRYRKITLCTAIITLVVVAFSITVLATPLNQVAKDLVKKLAIPSAGINQVVNDYVDAVDESDVQDLAQEVLYNDAFEADQEAADSAAAAKSIAADSQKSAKADNAGSEKVITAKDTTAEATNEVSEEYVNETYAAPDTSVIEEIVYEEPVIEEPVYEEPVYEEPAYDATLVLAEVSDYEEPVYEEPVTEEPVMEEPVYDGIMAELDAVQGELDENVLFTEEEYVAEDVLAETDMFVTEDQALNEFDVLTDEMAYDAEAVATEDTFAAEDAFVAEEPEQVYYEEPVYVEALYEEPVYEEETLAQFLEEQDAQIQAEAALQQADVAVEQPASSGLGAQVAADAMQYVGWLPYVWAGSSLETGADCSGFTMALYAQYGINLSHIPEIQATEGRYVTLEEALPGDIVCYGGHVALYIGNGQVVHEPYTGATATVADVNMMPIVSITRIAD